MRTRKTANEKLSDVITGIETNATTFSNENVANEQLNDADIAKFNNEVDRITEKMSKYVDEVKQSKQGLNGGAEIIPMRDYLLVEPFKTNPFQQIVKDYKTGIVLDLGGYTPEWKSNDTGEIEEAEQWMRVATVIETGPECKFIKPGDAIFYSKPSEVTIPFYKHGFCVVQEARVFAVVNEGLTERKNKI